MYLQELCEASQIVMWDNMSYIVIKPPKMSRQRSCVRLFLCKKNYERFIYSLHALMYPDVFIFHHSTYFETKIKSLLKKDTWSFTQSPRGAMTEEVQKCWHYIICQKHSFIAGNSYAVSTGTHWCTRLLLQIPCVHNCQTVFYMTWGLLTIVLLWCISPTQV
jgi:hypothetical protein